MTPKEAQKNALLHASHFFRRYREDPKARQTFGYFTHHPVAKLNGVRLETLLARLEERSRTLHRPLRVLDLACGGGLISCAISSLGHRVLGLDLDAQEIALARKYALEEKQNALFHPMDVIEDPKWEAFCEETLGGRPDVIVLAYALHHLPRVEEFLSRVSTWLPPESWLLVNEENPRSPLFRLKHRVRGLIQRDTEQENHRTFEGWKSLLEQRGFQVSDPVGADPLPGLARVRPSLCWSLIFTARRSP
ncbi:MAG: class I SAM-dependent methyltransferase [Bdellovibrionota bacterium]